MKIRKCGHERLDRRRYRLASNRWYPAINTKRSFRGVKFRDGSGYLAAPSCCVAESEALHTGRDLGLRWGPAWPIARLRGESWVSRTQRLEIKWLSIGSIISISTRTIPEVVLNASLLQNLQR